MSQENDEQQTEARTCGRVKWFNNSAGYGFITATDVADYLVKNHSISFRKAYQKTAEIVNYAEKKKKN